MLSRMAITIGQPCALASASAAAMIFLAVSSEMGGPYFGSAGGDALCGTAGSS